MELSLAFLILWWAFEAQKGELEKRISNIVSSPIFRAVSIFTLVFVLATLFADDPHIAFWSNYERGEGGFQVLHYYAFFALMGILFQNRSDWMKLFKLSAVAAILMIVYGIGAAMLLPNFIGPYQGSADAVSVSWFDRVFSDSRFQGSLGNPAYVAPYLIFAMFFVLYHWFSQKEAVAWTRRLLYLLLIAIFLTFFVLSQTRGGFLGLSAAVILFFVYLGFAEKRTRKAAVVGMLSLLLLGGAAYVFKDPLVKANVPGSRFLTISFTEQTAQTRFWTWGSAWQGFKDRPLLGWGPENFSTVFDKYFDTRHFIPGQNTETWFDRAHGVIFDYLAETGILGLLSYMGMFAAFYYKFFSKSGDGKWPVDTDGKTIPLDNSPILKGLLLVVPVAYFVQGLILFDVLPIIMNFMIVLAFAMMEFAKRPASANQAIS